MELGEEGWQVEAWAKAWGEEWELKVWEVAWAVVWVEALEGA